MVVQNSNICSTVYISGACNSNPFAASWGQNNEICMAIDSSIGLLKTDLYNGAPGKIRKVYFTHKSRVNVLKWIHGLNIDTENSFISGSVDTTAVIWIQDPIEIEYIPKYVLRGHNDAIVDVEAVSLLLPDGTDCILAATMSVDTLMLWKILKQNDSVSRLQIFHFPEVGIGASGISFSLLPDTQSLIFAFPRKFVDVCLCTSSLAFEDDHTDIFEKKEILTGHTNWINDLTFTTCDDKTLLLASASHDCTIRIWRILLKQTHENKLTLRESILFVESKRFSVTLCSILHGHDQWIYTVQWKHFNKEKKKESLKLLSVSADKNAIVWQYDKAVDTWTENYRLGDVGGNQSGFLGGQFDPTGQFIMCHDLLGAFHVWKYNETEDTWFPAVLPSGHNDEVTDIQWDPNGRFLMSVSADKTTRLHAPWRKDSSCWYEFARPQTHGHVISCLTVLWQCRFISGATEKEMRSFIAPKNFIKSLKKSSFLEDFDESKYPHNSAILPSLDLSNKPADELENIQIQFSYGSDVDRNNQTIPTEDELSTNTLWPEIQKLYYHPNEISCVTSNFDSSLIASACKATSPKEASIVIWYVKKWDEIERIQELWFHQLTVTQLAFSPDGIYLLSVSRDRTWNLYKRNNSENTFVSVAYSSKTNSVHKRQINSCAWSHDSIYFVTASRDGKIVIWTKTKNQLLEETFVNSSLNGYSNCYTFSVPEGNVTTVAFAPGFVKSYEYLIAAGFNTGQIALYIWNGEKCHNWLTLSENTAHHKAVMKLVFRPLIEAQKTSHTNDAFQLASAGADRLVRIHNLNMVQMESL